MRLVKLKFIIPIWFFLGCAATGGQNSAKTLSTAAIAPVLHQQAEAECRFEAVNFIPMSRDNKSQIYRGFLARDIYGNCMNAKGFAWGRP